MSENRNTSCPQSTAASPSRHGIRLGGRLASALRAGVAALVLIGGASAALAQVTVTTDITTKGDWIGTYGSCAYVLPAAKVSPGIETPILGSGCATSTCGADGLPPLTGGGGNFGGGASNLLQDCRGQTATVGLSDNITYKTRLCSVPPGYSPTLAQGYVWSNPNPGQVPPDPAGCMMLSAFPTFNQTLEFPTDARGLASCQPLGDGCTFRQEMLGSPSVLTAGRIASTWDDAGEVNPTPPQGAGLCVDIDLSSAAINHALSYKLSGYFLDYDQLGRDLVVQLINTDTTAVLASSPVSAFQLGKYVSFSNLTPLPNHLTLQINRASAADINAVLSGLFLDRSDGSACQVPPAPHITVKKLTNGVDTPLPGDGLAPQVLPGSTVTWTYQVTNDGTENLVNVAVNDDKVGFICTVGALNVGASATCTKTGTAVQVPTGGVMGVCGGVSNKPLYENKGTATGNGAGSGTSVSATYLSHYCNPPGSFTLTKNPKGATYNIGDNINFTMVVTSTGPGTALNVVLNDPLPTLGNLNTWTFSAGGNPGNVCTISAANVLNCPFGDLVSGQTRTVTVTTNAAGGANATACTGVKLNNIATVSATGLSNKTDTGDYTCRPPPPGGLIAPTQTTCQDVRDGTASALGEINYTVGKDGKVAQNVSPGVFFYYAKITVPANTVVTVAESQNDAATLFQTHQGDARLWKGDCSSWTDGTLNASNTGASYTIATAGTYIISIKYDSKSIAGTTPPTSDPVTYTFTATPPGASSSGSVLLKLK